MSENCLLSDVQFVIVGLMLRKTLNPTCHSTQQEVHLLRSGLTCLCYCFSGISEVGTSPNVRSCQEVFYQPDSNVIAHLIELLVNFLIVSREVSTQLCHHSAICQSHELRVHFVDSCSLQSVSQKMQSCLRAILLPYSWSCQQCSFQTICMILLFPDTA